MFFRRLVTMGSCVDDGYLLREICHCQFGRQSSVQQSSNHTMLIGMLEIWNLRYFRHFWIINMSRHPLKFLAFFYSILIVFYLLFLNN